MFFVRNNRLKMKGGKRLLKQIETFNNLQCPHNFNAFQYFTAITLVHKCYMLRYSPMSISKRGAAEGRMNAMCGTHGGLKDKKKCNNIFAFFVMEWI